MWFYLHLFNFLPPPQIMLYGRYVMGGTLNYVILAWKARAMLAIPGECVLALDKGCGGAPADSEGVRGRSPGLCGNLKPRQRARLSEVFKTIPDRHV